MREYENEIEKAWLMADEISAIDENASIDALCRKADKISQFESWLILSA